MLPSVSSCFWLVNGSHGSFLLGQRANPRWVRPVSVSFSEQSAALASTSGLWGKLVPGCTGFNESVLGRRLKAPIKHREFKIKHHRAGMSFLSPNLGASSWRLCAGEPLVFLKFQDDKNSNCGFVLKVFKQLVKSALVGLFISGRVDKWSQWQWQWRFIRAELAALVGSGLHQPSGS